MNPCKYKIGDEVDLSQWDRTERPVNRMGRCVVAGVRRAQCQTGWMVRIRSLDRPAKTEMELDADWLNEVPQ